MSESRAISLALEWKISISSITVKTYIIWTLNIFNWLNNSFNLFLIIGLVFISCNSGSKIFKISTLHRYMKLCMISTYFSTSSYTIKRFSNFAKVFLLLFYCRFRIFTNIYGTLSFTSSSVKTFKWSSIFGIYNIIFIIVTKLLSD